MKLEMSQLETWQENCQVLLDAIPYMAWYSNIDGQYYKVNQEFLNHSGKSIDEIIGKNHQEVWGEIIGDECFKNDLDVLKSGCSAIHKELVPGKLGYRNYLIKRSPVKNNTGEVVGIIAVATDITEVNYRDHLLDVFIENVPFGVWFYDKEGNYILANSQFAHYIGYENAEQLKQLNIRDHCPAELLNPILDENKEMLQTKTFKKINREYFQDNQKKSIEIYKTPVFDLQQDIIGFVGTLVDITEEKLLKEKLIEQLYVDSLTGLNNRRALYQAMEQHRNKQGNSVILVDIKHFNKINDVYGHRLGDEVLVKVAQTLKKLFPDGMLFRVHGDQFMFMFNKLTNHFILEQRAQDILTALKQIDLGASIQESISGSIGIASCACDRHKCEKGGGRLLVRADLALLKAKENDKNQYVIYSDVLEKEKLLHMKMERALQHAVERDEIVLFYQPQYSTTKQIVGFEALLRWNHPEYNKTPIPKVISLMEKHQLMIPIGYEIMRKACLFAKKVNNHRLRPIIIWINVSAIQLMCDQFISTVENLLMTLDVSPSTIGIEITETVLLENIEENVLKIKKLKEMGIKISLDDFGTGYSSFSYLVQLPLSEVKIDQSFVSGMNEREEYKTLIKLMIDSSHSLKLATVAEGVEMEEQLQILKELGVDYLQGYYFAKPLPEAEALKLLE